MIHVIIRQRLIDNDIGFAGGTCIYLLHLRERKNCAGHRFVPDNI